jgi:biotin operon repressor
MRPDDIKPNDLRKYSILPFTAVMDKRINRTRALHVLAALCSYVDRNGVTFVSQDRLAADLGISRQAVNKQLTILKDLGYWVYAKKRYKDQKTSSVKVIYDPDVTTEEEAYSTQTAAHQIALSQESGETSGVAGETGLGATSGAPGETSEVARPETSDIAHNETTTGYNEDFKVMVKVYCNHFLRTADSLGQHRTITERDQAMMSTWISHGLLEAEWRHLLNKQAAKCREKRQDWPRSVAYFEEIVKASLRRVPNPMARSLLAGIKKRSDPT